MEDSYRHTVRYDYGSTSERKDGDGAVVGLPESEAEGSHPQQNPHRHYQSCPNSPLLSPPHRQPPRSSAGAENGDDEGLSSLTPSGGTRDAAAAGHHHDGSGKKNSVLIASLAIFACAFAWLAAAAYLNNSDGTTEPEHPLLGSPTGIPVDPPLPPSVPLLQQGVVVDGRKEFLAAEERHEVQLQQHYHRGGGGDRGKKFPSIERPGGDAFSPGIRGGDDRADTGGGAGASNDDQVIPLFQCNSQCEGDYQCSPLSDCSVCGNYDAFGYGECIKPKS